MGKRRVRSAGLLLYRMEQERVEVLLAHMGGPFWARKDARAWSIPKGEYEQEEEALAAARREFEEETGSPPPDGPAIALGEMKQASGKIIAAWGISGNFDPATLRSNSFTMEWPPKSGLIKEFPEVDRAEWFDLDTARQKLVLGQIDFIERLVERLKEDSQAKACLEDEQL